MSNWNLFAFQDYRQDTFPMMERLLADQQDGRASSSNSIDASQPAESFFFQVLLGQSGLHQLDQWLRGTLADLLFNRAGSASDFFGSDTTLLNAAEGWSREDIQSVSYQLTQRLGQQGHLSVDLPGHQTVRPAALDGSDFGGPCFSVLTCPGSDVQSVLDLQPYDFGQELNASRRIIRRLNETLDSVPFSHLVLDGL